MTRGSRCASAARSRRCSRRRCVSSPFRPRAFTIGDVATPRLTPTPRPPSSSRLQPPEKAKFNKARPTDDSSSSSSHVKSIAALLDSVPPSSTPPAPTSGAHPNANKTRLTESQRARAKLVRDGWVKAEGLSAKDANSRWVEILSAAGWNGEVALLVAKHFGGGGGGKKKTPAGAQGEAATTDALALQSYSYSAASTPTPTAGDAESTTDASPLTPPAAQGSSGGLLARPTSPPARASLKRRRVPSSASPSPAYFNPSMALAAPGPSPASTSSSLPASTGGAVPDSASPTTTTAAASSLPDPPAPSPSPTPTAAATAPSDRSLSTRAIRVLQQLALADLAPETMLDLVDAFHSDAQTAEVFLALEVEGLRALWVRRRAARSMVRGEA